MCACADVTCLFDVRELSKYSCPLCLEFTGLRFHHLLSHIQLVHSSRPGFQIVCGINGCTRSFTLMKTYRNPLYGDHIINFNPNSIVYQPSSLVDSHSKVSSNSPDTITSVPNDLLHQDFDISESDCNFSSLTSLQVCCMNQSYTSMYKFIIIL